MNMLKNYLKVAFRRFRRGGTHAAINVVGLALGMATCALIFLLVYHEWSFDRFHANADQIHRVYFEYTSPAGDLGAQTMMRPEFTPIFKSSFPVIEKATRLVRGNGDIKVGEESTRHILVEVDADFFEIFSTASLAGDPVATINDPGSMVITTKAATRLFNIESDWSQALGRVVTIPYGDEQYDFSIGAVIEKMPKNSSITFDVAISFENYDNMYIGGNNWGGRTSTYVQLSDAADPVALEASFPPFTEVHFGEYVSNMRTAERIAAEDESYALKLQPLVEMHRDVNVNTPYETNAQNPIYSLILSGIALLILLIACINFMTLSVGQSTIRAREVGVRKVLGANRVQIMRQHWGESIVISLIALAIGLALAVLALPAFNNLVGTELDLSSVPRLTLAMTIMLIVIVVGVVAGSYPAAVLSRFQPSRVLKGSIATPRNGLLTRSLVVLQFTVSIGLIACTGIMSQQLRFLLNTDLGFEDEFVLAVDARQVSRSEADGVISYFRDQLLQRDDIVSLSRAGNTFTRGSDQNGWGDAAGVPRSAYNFGVGYDWFDVLGMEIVEGRSFSPDFPGDATNSIVVNEALVREFGIEEPIGHVMTNWLSDIYEESPTVIGVVKDFKFRSLRNEVSPAIMNMHPDYYNYFGALVIKVRPDDVAGSIKAVERAWNAVLPGKPFVYSFVDEDLATQYATEKRWQTIVTYSSLLAIIIACLGLFGLAILTVGRRTKEIGVRKVLGASVGGVATLLSREFAVLVVIASLIAAPVAYFAMRAWLAAFAYKITIGPWIFLAATFVTMAIALGTVSIHAVRAAKADPVKALRYE